MSSDFTCDSFLGTSVISGTIKSINRNVLKVRDGSENDYLVHIGGCSRFESATGNAIPRIGDRIYWKGAPRYGAPKGHYNAYQATCY